MVEKVKEHRPVDGVEELRESSQREWCQTNDVVDYLPT